MSKFMLQTTSRLSATAIMVSIVAAALVSPTASAGKYRAFYYDAQNRLLQVEDVPDSEIDKRTLVDYHDSLFPIPLLTKKDAPIVDGENIPMSRLAAFAVYYTFEEISESPDEATDVAALPDQVEYLALVGNRTLATCLPLTSTDPCPFPKRCHCSTKTCCCY